MISSSAVVEGYPVRLDVQVSRRHLRREGNGHSWADSRRPTQAGSKYGRPRLEIAPCNTSVIEAEEVQPGLVVDCGRPLRQRVFGLSYRDVYTSIHMEVRSGVRLGGL